ARRAGGILRKVEGLRAREREDVMEDVVLVGKLDGGALYDGKDVGDELLAALDHRRLRHLWIGTGGERLRRIELEVEDDVGVFVLEIRRWLGGRGRATLGVG